jgi:hypothetical protein
MPPVEKLAAFVVYGQDARYVALAGMQKSDAGQITIRQSGKAL